MKINGFASVESVKDMIKRLNKLLETSKNISTIRKGKKRGGGKIMYGYKAGGKV